MSEPTLSTYEVAAALDVSYRQLDYWVRTGRIDDPRLRDVGSGHRRRWRPVHIHRAAILARASRLGALSHIDELERRTTVIDRLEPLPPHRQLLRYVAVYRERRFRFTLSDETVVEVRAVVDDDELRDRILDELDLDRSNGLRIVSGVEIEERVA